MAQCIKRQIELSLHMTLKRLPESHTRWGFQMVVVGIFNDFCHVASPLGNMGSDIGHNFLVCNGIADTNAEPIVKKPVVDDFLNASEKLSSRIRSLFTEDDMDKTTLRGANSLLLHDTIDHFQSSFHHQRQDWGFRVRVTMNIDTARNCHTKDLLASPEQLGFDDGRYRDYSIPLGHP